MRILYRREKWSEIYVWNVAQCWNKYKIYICAKRTKRAGGRSFAIGINRNKFLFQTAATTFVRIVSSRILIYLCLLVQYEYSDGLSGYVAR